MFIGDKTKKTVRILVRIRAGKVARSDGTPLPRVLDGTLGDLVLPSSHLIDEAERRELEQESLQDLLPEGSVVFVGLSPGMINGKPRGLLRPADLKTPYACGYFFAEVRLLEPLKMRMRGDKEPVLENCRCSIPRLGMDAKSLNHAFTLLSSRFETKRISHTGNVFARAYCYSGVRKVWHPLNELRGHIEYVIPSVEVKANARTLLAKIVEELRLLQAKLSGADSPLANPWEEIKYQVQQELSSAWPAYLATMNQVINFAVNKLTPTELTFLASDLKVSAEDDLRIRDTLLGRLIAKARKEKIRYKPFDFEYFWYAFSDISIYTRINKRTGMHTCWVRAYSGAAPYGEEGEIDVHQIDGMADIHIMTAEEFEKARSLNWPDRWGSDRLQSSAHAGQVPSRLSAAEVLSRVQRLRDTNAQWDAIWLQLNPTDDPEVQRLLIEIRGPQMFDPHLGLSVIEDGCKRALAISTNADAVAALREAVHSQDPFVR